MKMAEAVELVDTYGTVEVDEALSTAAMLHRLGVGDLLSILRSRTVLPDIFDQRIIITRLNSKQISHYSTSISLWDCCQKKTC